MFVPYYLTVLVHIKITIHLSVGDQWWIFTEQESGEVNNLLTPVDSC